MRAGLPAALASVTRKCRVVPCCGMLRHAVPCKDRFTAGTPWRCEGSFWARSASFPTSCAQVSRMLMRTLADGRRPSRANWSPNTAQHGPKPSRSWDPAKINRSARGFLRGSQGLRLGESAQSVRCGSRLACCQVALVEQFVQIQPQEADEAWF